MTSINDYISRTVDLLVLHGGQVSEQAEELVGAFALPGTGGTITAGLQKLAQRTFLELLQEIGSEPYFPTRGCSYLTELRSGIVQTPSELLNAFARGVQQARRTLLAEETAAMPDDERLGTIETLSVVLEGDVAAVTFRVTSLAGDTAVYLMPANFTL
jgi:hypothetical protein